MPETKDPNSSKPTSPITRSNNLERQSGHPSSRGQHNYSEPDAIANPADPRPSQDPEVARKNVAAVRQKVSQAKERNDSGTAFRLSVAAWDEARQFPKDAGLRTATEELAAEIKILSQQANTKHDAANDSFSTLVEK